jgi:hypothetical protein
MARLDQEKAIQLLVMVTIRVSYQELVKRFSRESMRRSKILRIT